jgi:hypothetical protein
VTKGEEAAFAHATEIFKTLIVNDVNRMVAEAEAKILNIFELGPAE